jgi:hypothetical protein
MEHSGFAIQEAALFKGNTLYFAKNVFLVTEHSFDQTYAYGSDNKAASVFDF